MVVLGGMGNVWGVTIGALILAWTNSTAAQEAQNAIEKSEGTRQRDRGRPADRRVGLIAGGLLLMSRRRRAILIFLAVPLGAIGDSLDRQGSPVASSSSSSAAY
jgi:ABC-type branched-subunit amino acid transport system permease subunit